LSAKSDPKAPILSPESMALMRALTGGAYYGILETPLEPIQILPNSPALATRVRALFMHFGINPNGDGAWQELALSLARSHVPGFQLASVQGRSRSLGYEDINLLMLVRIFLRSPRIKNESAAIRKLLELNLFSGNYEMLRKRLRRAHKRYADVLANLFELVDQGHGDYILELLLPR
jgi:hypothetical protein